MKTADTSAPHKETPRVKTSARLPVSSSRMLFIAAFLGAWFFVSILTSYAWVADGIDPSFDAGEAPRIRVEALTLDNQGRIYVSTADQILRLLPDGHTDTSFQTNRNFGASVLSMELQPDGKLLLAGFISRIGTTSITSVTNLVRLSGDGSLDPTFKVSVEGGGVYKVLTQPAEEKIIIAGTFEAVNGRPASRLARLNQDGSLDATFQSTAITNGMVSDLAWETNGSFLAVGNYSTVVFGETKIARFRSDGTIDPTYAPVADSLVLSVIPTDDAGCIIAGAFTQVNGVPKSQLAKLATDGSLDVTFNASDAVPNGMCSRVARVPDGSIVALGSFKSAKGTRKVVRLLANGSSSHGYDVYLIDGTILEFAVQPDGKILIAGDFKTTGSLTRRKLARLNRDALLKSFTQGTNLVLYWPLSYAEFKLERTTNCADVGSWAPVDSPPSQVNVIYCSTNSISTISTFFRLSN